METRRGPTSTLQALRSLALHCLRGSQCLKICRQGLAYHHRNLSDITDAELQEYATRRFIRDAYVHDPKRVAADLHQYRNDYAALAGEMAPTGR